MSKKQYLKSQRFSKPGTFRMFYQSRVLFGSSLLFTSLRFARVLPIQSGGRKWMSLSSNRCMSDLSDLALPPWCVGGPLGVIGGICLGQTPARNNGVGRRVERSQRSNHDFDDRHLHPTSSNSTWLGGVRTLLVFGFLIRCLGNMTLPLHTYGGK